MDHVGTPNVHKMGINASNFIASKTTRDLIDKIPKARVSIGHVRAATVGWISADNAHPFKVFREDGTYIVGAHNGTLKNWRSKKDAEKYDVDSEWLFHMLSIEGHDAFEYFDGAFALVWYDSATPSRLYMARNEERSLHYLVTEDGKTILGASELGMLGWTAGKHGFKCSKDFPTPYYLRPGKIYSFSIDNPGMYTAVDYPAHDPATTLVPQSSKVLAPANFSYVDQEWDYEDETGHWGNYAGKNQSSRGYSRSYYDNAETVLSGVKTALREARYASFKKANKATELIDNDSLETALIGALKEHEDKKKAEEIEALAPFEEFLKEEATSLKTIEKGTTFLTGVEGATATTVERQAAKDLTVYGMVIGFNALYYDDDEGVLLGSFNVMDGGRMVEFEAEIRMLTSRLANDRFVNRPASHRELGVVVGVHPSAEWMVVEPLTPAMRKQLEPNTLLLELDASKASVH